jgi:hypothetical protein
VNQVGLDEVFAHTGADARGDNFSNERFADGCMFWGANGVMLAKAFR